MTYQYTYQNDVPVVCSFTIRELELLRELTVEAVKEDGWKYNELNCQLQDAIKRASEAAAVHFTWQKNNIERLEKEGAKAKAEA